MRVAFSFSDSFFALCFVGHFVRGKEGVLMPLGFVAKTLRSLMESDVLFFHEVGSNNFL